MPGRTGDNDCKNFWKTYKKKNAHEIDQKRELTLLEVHTLEHCISDAAAEYRQFMYDKVRTLSREQTRTSRLQLDVLHVK